MKRIKKGVKSLVLQHFMWKCCFFKTVTNPTHSQHNYLTLDCNKSWKMSHILEGVMRLPNDVIVEYDGMGRSIRVDVSKKELLGMDGLDLSRLQHNAIVDLSVEGDRWEGDVLNDEPCGWGVLYDKDNEKAYEGFRVGDVNVCYGRTYHTGISMVEYDGEWCGGMRCGRGTQFDRNGAVMYDGEWMNGERDYQKRVEIVFGSELLHNLIEELCVSDRYGNDEDFTVLNLSVFAHLRELRVESRCFENVKKVKLIGLSELEIVVIGMNSFTQHKGGFGADPDRHFYLKNCPKLKKLIMGRYAFSDYTVCEIESVDALKTIEMGEMEKVSYNFHYASLELKSIFILTV